MSPKRFLDVTASFAGLIILSPVLAVLAVAVRLESPGPAFFLQERVGRNGRRFRIIKLRTMVATAQESGPQITVASDPRITKLGSLLRKTKLDELPQLFNVLKGEMSLVGPRPEVATYLDRYTSKQKEIILSVRPGMTDFAAIEFSREAEILSQAIDPERAYVEEIMPEKFKLYERYIAEQSICLDIEIIILTVLKIVQVRN